MVFGLDLQDSASHNLRSIGAHIAPAESSVIEQSRLCH